MVVASPRLVGSLPPIPSVERGRTPRLAPSTFTATGFLEQICVVDCGGPEVTGQTALRIGVGVGASQ